MGKKLDRLNSIKAAKVKIDLLATYSVLGTVFIWLTFFLFDETKELEIIYKEGQSPEIMSTEVQTKRRTFE